jgi:hypothetical protein
VDAEYVRVSKARSEMNLVEKSLGTCGPNEGAHHYFHRDLASMADVAGQKYRRHSTASNLALDHITA